MSEVAGAPTVYGSGPARRRRTIALALTIAAHILLLLLFLTLAPRHFVEVRPNGTLSVFSVTPAPSADTARRMASPPAANRPETVESATTSPPRAVPAPKVTTPAPLRMPEGFIELSRDDAATVTTAMITSRPPPPPPDTNRATDADRHDSDTPSTLGPRGERLYAAEWYREPTRAEMVTYLPAHAVPPVWGVIACRTVARFHVDDCYELGDSQPGAGVARAMRQAAFQFLVRPPHVGGRSMVGEWVTIKYTLLPARKDGDGDDR